MERVLEKVVRHEGDRCWGWSSTVTTKGYAMIWDPDRANNRPAHRLMYEHFIGPVPEGLQLDHLCRNRSCVNPYHLEPVTARENVLRGTGPTAINAARTQCKNGHEFTPENTYLRRSGGRSCIECGRIKSRAYQRRIRNAV